MPEQSLLRIIKRWRRYELRKDWKSRVPPRTRGFYVLYRQAASRERDGGRSPQYEVVYIGIAGTGAKLRRGIQGRLSAHNRNREDWTHFSVIEVHDNVTRDEIRELESILLAILGDDPRIALENKQMRSGRLAELCRDSQWPEESSVCRNRKT